MLEKEQAKNVQTGTSTLTLLLVAVLGGIVAVSLQPLILLLYSHLGIPTALIAYQPPSSGIMVEQIPTTTIVTTEKVETVTTTTTVVTTAKAQTTTMTSKNDPTVDEEPILLRDEPVTIKIPASTTVKPVMQEKPKKSKVDKSEEISQSIKLKKTTQQPELIDVTGRNKQIPDEVKNFKPTRISMFIPIPPLSQTVPLSLYLLLH